MRNFFRFKPKAKDLFKQKGLSLLSTLIGIFPDGIDDDVFDFSTVQLENPHPDESHLLDLELPEIILHSLKINCSLKQSKISKEIDQLDLAQSAEGLLKDLSIKSMSYVSIANACGLMMNARVSILLARRNLEIAPGYVVVVRTGFQIFAKPFPQAIIISFNSDDLAGRTDLESIFRDSEDSDDDFKTMAKKAGVKITKNVGKA